MREASSTPTELLSFEVADQQVVALYSEILLPWERGFIAVEGQWNLAHVHEHLATASLEVSSVGAKDIEDRLQVTIERGRANFFIFARGKSQGRDLFRHLRNAIAHAGVTLHRFENGSDVLRFKSPGLNKNTMAMAGQLEVQHLGDLIQGLHEMASQVVPPGEA